MQKFPQVLLNVKVAKRFDPSVVPAVQEAMARIERHMAGEGRVVLRPSGTEPVIRVMVEGRDEGATRAAATELAESSGRPRPPKARGRGRKGIFSRPLRHALHRYHRAPLMGLCPHRESCETLHASPHRCR